LFDFLLSFEDLKKQQPKLTLNIALLTFFIFRTKTDSWAILTEITKVCC